MSIFTMPVGYEKIDGAKYPTREAQNLAYEDIQVSRMSSAGAFLYGKPRAIHTFPLRWPLDKIFITQPFGANPQIYAQFGLKGHDGIDLRTRYLDSPLAHRPVYAAADGFCEVRNDGHSGYGLHVRIHHLDGSMTIYGHLSSIRVYDKSVVKQGDKIGITGNSGFSTAPHLHFEYRPPHWNVYNGFAGAIDPMPLLPPI